jgi:hypothetical protein
MFFIPPCSHTCFDSFDRLTVQQGLEHPFLSVEPEVVLLFANETKTHLTLQVVFKGLDKLSAKFEFNTETDTAEEVVHEMVRIFLSIFNISNSLD